MTALLGGPATASVLFTSFIGSDAGGDTTNSTFEGLQFTATASGQLWQVIFQGFPLDSANPVTWPLTLYQDAGGEPGVALETWNVSNLSSAALRVTLDSVVQPTITAGQTYWLVLQNTTPGTVADMGWEVYNGTTLGYDIGQSDALNSMANAFPGTPGAGLELDSVPEPASSALIGAGCLLLLAMAWRRKARGSALA